MEDTTAVMKVNVAGHFIYCDHISFGDVQEWRSTRASA